MKTSLSIRQSLLAASAVALFGMTACASVPKPAPSPSVVAQTVAADPQLSTLAALIKSAGMQEALAQAGPYTLFAPSNEAFKALPHKTLDELAKDPIRLKAQLSYHVVSGKLWAQEIKPGTVKSLQGGNLALSKAGEFVLVEEAMVQQADIPATNGVVHVIDRVLTPPAAR
jgi:uncharacterized surface protein with fasciclin (FAS1) repeats